LTFEVPTVVNVVSKASGIVTLRTSQICISIYISRVA